MQLWSSETQSRPGPMTGGSRVRCQQPAQAEQLCPLAPPYARPSLCPKDKSQGRAAGWPSTKADLPPLLTIQPLAPPGRGREWGGPGFYPRWHWCKPKQGFGGGALGPCSATVPPDSMCMGQGALPRRTAKGLLSRGGRTEPAAPGCAGFWRAAGPGAGQRCSLPCPRRCSQPA